MHTIKTTKATSVGKPLCRYGSEAVFPGFGLIFTTAFTWSTSYDFGTHNAMDPFLTYLDRAPEDSNRKLVFVASHI